MATDCPIPSESMIDLVGNRYYDRGGDQSVGTYATNVLMAVANFIVIVQTYRLPLSNLTSKQQWAKRFAMAGNFFEAVSSLLAGYFHYEYIQTNHPAGLKFWRVVMLMLIASGVCRSLATSAIVVSDLLSNVIRKLTLVGYIVLAFKVVQEDLPFLVVGISAGVVPQLLQTLLILVTRYNPQFTDANMHISRAQKNGFWGQTAIFTGAAVYAYGLQHCANMCPTTCPFLPLLPNFNHNAVFHVFQTIAIVMLTRSTQEWFSSLHAANAVVLKQKKDKSS
eukprot:TRINITY_DN12434_c0_g1_i1.p1 TRINITY_DN12434_c0_g1~~TRINITY_DN12434_c0_g1_i1.p1  ORF type:complete len:279 (+),score=42.51 TRINITY_DN12434_c0_g1_i1:86-922(+)